MSDNPAPKQADPKLPIDADPAGILIPVRRGDGTVERLITRNLYQKLTAIAGEIGTLEARGHNVSQNFDFISWDAVSAGVQRTTAKYGVLLSTSILAIEYQEVQAQGGSRGFRALADLRLTFIDADNPPAELVTIEPENRSLIVMPGLLSAVWKGEGIDYGDKVTQKAVTSATKYFLMKHFLIAEPEGDPDAVDTREHAAPTYKDGDKAPAEVCPVCKKRGMNVWSNKGPEGGLIFKCNKKAGDGYCPGRRPVSVDQQLDATAAAAAAAPSLATGPVLGVVGRTPGASSQDAAPTPGVPEAPAQIEPQGDSGPSLADRRRGLIDGLESLTEEQAARFYRGQNMAPLSRSAMDNLPTQAIDRFLAALKEFADGEPAVADAGESA